MYKGRLRNRKALLTVVLFVLLFLISIAWARNPEDVFAGRVIITYKPVPTYFKSAAAMISYVNSHSISIVDENEKHDWEFEILSFFKRPLGDFETQVVFYDIEKGGEKLMSSFTMYVQNRDARVVGQKVLLKRADGFQPNWRYSVIVKSRQKVLAEKAFALRGTPVRYDGVVDFTKDEKGAK